MSDVNQGERTRHQVVGLFLGPLLSIAMLLSGAPEGLSHEGWMTASVGVLMAVWWATEAVPIAVTALLPESLPGRLLLVLAAGLAGILAYMLMAVLFNIQEAKALPRLLRRRK